MITGIVVALPEELKTLTRLSVTKGSCAYIENDVVVALAGAGADNAKTAAELLVAQGATQLISWGCAAALSEQLKPGDLALATSLMGALGRKEIGFEVSGAWQTYCTVLLSPVLTVHAGLLAESKGIVAASDEKKRLYIETGAYALDMESIAVAVIAKQFQYPFLAVRAIADPVDMDLPAAISAALNSEGDVVLLKLLEYLLMHPSELPKLIKLGLQFNAACKTLKVVAGMLDELIHFDQINDKPLTP